MEAGSHRVLAGGTACARGRGGTEEEGLLGFAVGHHTHDADHEQGDADAGDGQHPLLVELLRFWKGMRVDVTKGPLCVPGLTTEQFACCMTLPMVTRK